MSDVPVSNNEPAVQLILKQMWLLSFQILVGMTQTVEEKLRSGQKQDVATCTDTHTDIYIHIQYIYVLYESKYSIYIYIYISHWAR